MFNKIPKNVTESHLSYLTWWTVGVIQSLSLGLNSLRTILAHVEPKLVSSITTHNATQAEESCDINSRF